MQKPVHSQEIPDSLLIFSQASGIGIQVCKFLWGSVQAWLCISAHDCHLPKVSNYCFGFLFVFPSSPDDFSSFRVGDLQRLTWKVSLLCNLIGSRDHRCWNSGLFERSMAWLTSFWPGPCSKSREFCVLNNETNYVVSAWYRCVVKLTTRTQWCNPLRWQIKLSGVVMFGLSCCAWENRVEQFLRCLEALPSCFPKSLRHVNKLCVLLCWEVVKGGVTSSFRISFPLKGWEGAGLLGSSQKWGM